MTLEFVGDAIEERELRGRTRKGQKVPDDFLDALRSAGKESKTRAIPDKREAFLAILEDLRSKGFEVTEASNELGIHMEFDMDSGSTITRANLELGARRGLAESIAAGIARALRGVLAAQPDKLRAALDRDDPEDFVNSLSARAIANAQERDAVLAATTTALLRAEWAKHHPEIHFNAGLMAVASKATSPGRALLRKAIDGGQLSADKQAVAWLAIANSHAEDRRFDVAADGYRALLDDETLSQQNVAWTHANLGRALLELQRIDEALESFRHAGDLRSSLGIEGEPYITRAKAASLLERLDARRALVLYDEIATNVDTKTTFSRSQKGNALLCAARIRCLELGDFDGALRDLLIAKTMLGEMFEDSEGFASLLTLEIQCHQASNDIAGAARVAAEREAFLSGRPHLKVDQFERALKGLPERRTGATDEALAGRVALMRGFDELDTLNGVAFFDKIEQLVSETLHPNDEETHFIGGAILSTAGDRLAQEGKWERALEYYARATAAYPASFEHRANIGQCLLKLNRFQETMEVGRKLAVHDPGSHVGFLLCGLAGYNAGSYTFAAQMLREALGRRPEHPLAKSLLEKAEQEALKLTLQGQPHAPALTDPRI